MDIARRRIDGNFGISGVVVVLGLDVGLGGDVGAVVGLGLGLKFYPKPMCVYAYSLTYLHVQRYLFRSVGLSFTPVRTFNKLV